MFVGDEYDGALTVVGVSVVFGGADIEGIVDKDRRFKRGRVHVQSRRERSFEKVTYLAGKYALSSASVGGPVLVHRGPTTGKRGAVANNPGADVLRSTLTKVTFAL